ncbi:galactose oxidase-like domain-containing protein [Nitrososphaera sp.]|uniref:galactose oxidase-like domain-containing protein n=1 Tax=Nitrososphaera sp. TaxID=1971748 RepID=UPI001848EA7A|nr:galactose oxidase-like domain-containing protein [Nitrososphaera sp.]NWG38174.1 DUF1929 domain-containing protein [Nitrososphaera sp.]
MSAIISRRDFLRFLAAGASTVAFGSLFALVPSGKGGRTIAPTYAQSAGSWSIGPSTSIVAIHVSLLHNGKMLIVAGSGYHTSFQNGPFYAKLADPNTGTDSSLELSEDLFCCGHAQLDNGNILVAGGTKDWDTVAGDGKWHGLSSAYEFDVATGLLVKTKAMAHGRWYPTCVTMGDGKVAVVAGYDEYGSDNKLTEVYDDKVKSFTIKFDTGSSLTYCVGNGSSLPGAGSPCYGGPGNGVNPYVSLYPRMHLMPSGLLFLGGMTRNMYTWEPSTGRWRWAANMSWPGWRSYGTSVLLPLQNSTGEKGKVLVAGGSLAWDQPATNHCEIADFNAAPNNFNPVIRTDISMYMNYARRMTNPVILPNGKVGVFGGAAIMNTDPVMPAELFDPVTETWTVLPSATVPRVYHSVALLLPDGRVWTASSTASRHDWELRTELFSPDYVLSGSRPVINGTPTVGGYGGSISIPTQNPQSISSVSMVRISNTTHHYNTEQRLVWLGITSKGGGNVTVSAPLNANLAPPGYYLIHVLNGNTVPSEGKIIKFPGTGSIINDKLPPLLRIASPFPGSVIKGPSGNVPVNVSGTATDAGTGVNNVIVKVGSNPYTFATPNGPGDWSVWSFSDKVTSAGPTTIKVIATDKADNKVSLSIPVTIAFN